MHDSISFSIASDQPQPSSMGATKAAAYQQVMRQIDAVLEGETDLLAAMVSVVCLLHHAFDIYFWTGFYRRVGPDQLLIGPYQGTLGCLHIPFDRGVCGACARSQQTVIVPDVHRFPGYIACDSRSNSEIVVPVFDRSGELMAVLDVDSEQYAAFDEVDAHYLEQIMARLAHFEAGPLVCGSVSNFG